MTTDRLLYERQRMYSNRYGQTYPYEYSPQQARKLIREKRKRYQQQKKEYEKKIRKQLISQTTKMLAKGVGRMATRAAINVARTAGRLLLRTAITTVRLAAQLVVGVVRLAATPQGLLVLVIGAGVLGIIQLVKYLKDLQSGTYEGEEDYGYGETQGPITAEQYKSGDKDARVKNKIILEARKQGVDPAFALAVAETESHFNQNAKSGVGAIGIFQLMPNTAKGLGVNPYNEDENIKGGIRLLKGYLKQYNGDKRMALAAYNWGSGNLAKKGIEAAPEETKNHYKKIMAAEKKFNDQLSKLSTTTLYPEGVTTPTVADTGKKVGKYSVKGDVKLSTQMADFLKRTGGTGLVTSGIRSYKAGQNYNKSHASGNKADIGLGGQNVEQIVNICVPIMRDKAIVHVAFECLGKKNDNYSSEQIYIKVMSIIRQRYPDIAKRITTNANEAWSNPDKFMVYHWGWQYGTGPHLDILINSAKYKPTPNKLSGEPKNKPKQEPKKKEQPKKTTQKPTPKQQPKNVVVPAKKQTPKKSPKQIDLSKNELHYQGQDRNKTKK